MGVIGDGTSETPAGRSSWDPWREPPRPGDPVPRYKTRTSRRSTICRRAVSAAKRADLSSPLLVIHCFRLDGGDRHEWAQQRRPGAVSGFLLAVAIDARIHQSLR